MDKLTFKSHILPIGEIRISSAFRHCPPHPEKLNQCYAFYMAHKRFDRQIIVDADNTLQDGYCAYIVAKIVGVKRLQALRVSAKPEPVEEPPKPTLHVGGTARVIGGCDYHNYKIGEKVELCEKSDTMWGAYSHNYDYGQYIKPEDLEPLT